MNDSEFSSKAISFFCGRRVAVTGGTGFIGSHLVEQLLQLDSIPIVLSRQTDPKFLAHLKDKIILRHCDNAKKSHVIEALQGCSIVMNLSASVAGIEYNSLHPASIFQDNLVGFINVIEAAKDLNVERFLVTSSACVYPRHCSVPTPESEGFLDVPEPTNSGYGWAKRMEEFLGASYAKEFGLSVAIARPYNSYGPRDNFSYERSHVIPALIRRAFETELDTFEVWGDGSHSRSFLYVDDFARGLIEVTAQYPEATAVNIGDAEEISIRAVATLIADRVSRYRNRKIIPKFNGLGLTGQPRRCCDTQKAQKVLSFKARVPFTTGLDATVDWYFKNEYSTMHLNKK
jgi:GDP-L-fucose synthase